MTTAAVIALIVLALLTIFQLALIFGAPLGRYAWGGKHRVLPRNLRVGSVFAIVTYAVFSVFVISKAGFAQIITDQSILSGGLLIMTGYFMVGIVMNAISRSKPERYTMTPVALVLAICFVIVASN